MNHLKKINAGVCLLQETKLSDSEQKKLETQYFNQIYFAIYNSKKEVSQFKHTTHPQTLHNRPRRMLWTLTETTNNISITTSI